MWVPMGIRKIKLADYEARPGDVLAFSGGDFVSRLVQLFTFSWYSHVAIVGKPRFNDILAGTERLDYAFKLADKLLLFESTGNFNSPDAFTGRKIDGFQAHKLETSLPARLRSGRVFVFRLLEPLDWTENNKLCEFLLAQYGKHYDYLGALKCATRFIKYLFREDDDYWFCSELVGQALEEVGRWDTENSSLQTPKSLIRDGVRRGTFGNALELVQ